MRFDVGSLSRNRRFIKLATKLRDEGYLWSVNPRGTHILIHRAEGGAVVDSVRSIEKFEWFLQKHIPYMRAAAKDLKIGTRYRMLGHGWVGELVAIEDIKVKLMLSTGHVVEDYPSFLREEVARG